MRGIGTVSTVLAMSVLLSGFEARAARIRLGPISAFGGYNTFAPYGWAPLSWYDPFFYGYVHPGFYSGFAYQSNYGEVKLRTRDRADAVYVNGAYAGPAKRLKSMWLEPGVYAVEVRPVSGAPFQQRVYVLSGKTLRLDAGDGR